MDSKWLYKRDSEGDTPLTRATHSGCMQIAEVMLEQEKLDESGNVKELPELHRAAYYGFDDVVCELVGNGENPDQLNKQGETPLHVAVRLGNVDAARALLENGAAVNVASHRGMTPLHWAAVSGDEELVDLLLEHNAGVEAQVWGAGGLTPIDLAVAMGYDEIAQKLRSRVHNSTRKYAPICPTAPGRRSCDTG